MGVGIVIRRIRKKEAEERGIRRSGRGMGDESTRLG